MESQTKGMADFHGLLVRRTFVDLGQPTVPIRLMNLTDQERRVQKGAEIATCEAVQSVRRVADDASEAKLGWWSYQSI